MLTRHLKLKINKSQERYLNQYLFHLSGVYNWAIRQIKLNANNGIYLSYYDLANLTSNHAKKIGINAQVFQATLKQAHNAWNRCFKKLAKEPRLKSRRNKLNSFVFPQILDGNKPIGNRIHLPGGFNFTFQKQDIPEGTIKQIKIVKKASGWYVCLIIDTVHQITKAKDTKSIIGIDTGFKSLITCSDGTKYDNTRIYVNAQKRLAQVQKGKNKKKIARFQERLANIRKDRNHKIALDIVRNHKEIYITNDNLKGQQKKFGKSVMDAGIGQLRNFISYKALNSGRKFTLVDSKNTTMTCSRCWALSGPTGLNGLVVRNWICSACGADHDRDINAAMVVLKTGSGLDLNFQKTSLRSKSQ